MQTFLNIHSHRTAQPSETVILNHILKDEDGCTPSEIQQEQWFSTGIHPWYPSTNPTLSLNRLNKQASLSSCMAIGEIGFDKLCPTEIKIQHKLFMQQTEVASTYGLPIIIHCVKAWNELFAAKKDLPTQLACIIHGFRGKPALAESLLNHGFYLSFGFHHNPESLKLCPIKRLFLESDEDPRSVEELYHVAAGLHSCHIDTLKYRCWDNFHEISPKNRT